MEDAAWSTFKPGSSDFIIRMGLQKYSNDQIKAENDHDLWCPFWTYFKRLWTKVWHESSICTKYAVNDKCKSLLKQPRDFGL